MRSLRLIGISVCHRGDADGGGVGRFGLVDDVGFHALMGDLNKGSRSSGALKMTWQLSGTVGNPPVPTIRGRCFTCGAFRFSRRKYGQGYTQFWCQLRFKRLFNDTSCTCPSKNVIKIPPGAGFDKLMFVGGVLGRWGPCRAIEYRHSPEAPPAPMLLFCIGVARL